MAKREQGPFLPSRLKDSILDRHWREGVALRWALPEQ